MRKGKGHGKAQEKAKKKKNKKKEAPIQTKISCLVFRQKYL